MSFVMLPPEVNSGRMYAGPGPGSLLSAASAWDNLASELYSTAQHYGSVVSGLTGAQWSGPAAQRMATAATPHVQWLTTTAGQAAQTGAQAKAAASAYAQAYAMTVPPPVIAANRAQYQMLVATNLFGQNAPAIAATEAQYAEYWAQDGEAMDGYAANSTAVTQGVSTQQFTPMAQTSDGGMAQTAAAASAQAQSTFAAGQQLLPSIQQAMTGLTSPLSGLANPAQILPPEILSLLGTVNTFGGIFSGFVTLPGILGTIWGLGAVNWSIIGGTAAAGAAAEAATAIGSVAPAAGAGATSAATLAAATASAGEGSVVGGLSVPPTWADAAPAMRVAAAALPAANIGAASGGGLLGGTPLFSGAPLATVAGRGVGGGFSGKNRQPDTRNRRASGSNKGRTS